MPESPPSVSPSPPQRKRRRRLMRIGAVLFGLLLAFVVVEAVVRIAGIHVYPPVEWVREKVEQHKKNPQSRMVHDEHAGWSPRPGVVTHKGMYRYESNGIRCGTPKNDYAL